MTPEQQALQTRRLFLEEQIWTNHQYIWDIKKECKEHVVVKGRIMYSPAKKKIVNTMEGRENETCCGASCAVQQNHHCIAYAVCQQLFYA